MFSSPVLGCGARTAQQRAVHAPPVPAVATYLSLATATAKLRAPANTTLLCLPHTAGVMGGAAADLLSEAGYRVSSWTRTPHDQEGVTCFFGPDQLQQFVSGADVLVCLLPLTPATRGIINAELLGWLPRGATLINAARGAHVVEADLLAALDGGQVWRACRAVGQEG